MEMTMETKEVQIEVTEVDIANGQRDNCELCPVALAVKRYVSDGVLIDVNLTTVSFIVDTEEKWFSRLPFWATVFIQAFDGSKADLIEPLTFPLSIPVEFLKK